MYKRKILWVIPRSFLPVSDGASKANKALLDSFFSLELSEDFDVTLLFFSEELKKEAPLLEKYKEVYPVEDVVICRKKTLAKGMGRIFQVLVNFTQSSALTPSFFDLTENRDKLSKLKDKSFDYIFFDGLHPFCGLRYMISDEKIIYRSHNVEYRLWDILSENFLKRFLLKYQGKKIKALESELVSSSVKVWTISEEDRSTYVADFKISDDDKVKFLPMSQNFNKVSDRLLDKNNSFQFLFVGKLDWYPNTEGLIWLLEKVVPFLSKNISVKIVGKGDFPKEKYLDLSNVEFLGYVEDLDLLYRESDASLTPIFSGSGTRIKVIEALAQGTPIVSSEFAVQGSGMTKSHCFQSDQPNEWINLLNNWDRQNARKMVVKAQADLAKIYGNSFFATEISKL
jgi:glycosyltransferase involved in cell wall biosynthesis